MPSEDLSFDIQGGQNIGAADPLTQAPLAPASTPSGIAGQESTLAPSGEEQIEMSRDASVPIIPYPVIFQFFQSNGTNSTSIDGEVAGNNFDLAQSKIVLDMLQKWSDTIKARAEEQRRKNLDPNEVRKAEENLPASEAMNAIINAANNPQVDPINFIPLLTVGLIFAGAGGMKEGMMIDVLSTRMVGINPQADQTPFISLYTPDLRAELGLLGAALLQGAAYVANSQTIFKNGGAAPEEVTAKAYAQQVMGLVSSNQLTLIVQALVAQQAEKTNKPFNEKLAKQLESQLKVILLSTALVALYISDKEGGTGWIKGQEYLGLVLGTNETFGKQKDLMDQIVKEIRSHLSRLPDGGAVIANTLANYFNQNPSLATLTNPSKVFAQIVPYLRRNPEDQSV